MARALGPLLSLDASGTVADLLTFGRTKGRAFVKRKPAANRSPSPQALFARQAIAFAGANWTNLLTAPQRQLWANLARPNDQTAYNVYVADIFRDPFGESYPRTQPSGAGGTPPTTGAIDPIAGPAGKQILLTWRWTLPHDSYGLFWARAENLPAGTTDFTPLRFELANDNSTHEVYDTPPHPGDWAILAVNFTLDGASPAIYLTPSVITT